MAKKKREKIWSYLLHLGFSMWIDHEIENYPNPHAIAQIGRAKVWYDGQRKR